MKAILRIAVATILLLTLIACEGRDASVAASHPQSQNIKIELINTLHFEAKYPSPIVPISTDSKEYLFFLTLVEPKIIRMNLDFTDLVTTNLTNNEETVVVDYIYNSQSKQLLLQTQSKTYASSDQVNISLAAYTLDGSLNWQRDGLSYIKVIPYGEDWMYVDGGSLFTMNREWTELNKIPLPDGTYFINQVTSSEIYLFEESMDKDLNPCWYAVSIDWHGNIIQKNITQVLFSPCILLNKPNESYVIANNQNGAVEVYSQSISGITTQIKTIQSPQVAMFAPTASITLNGDYYVFGTKPDTDNNSTQKNVLMKLNKDFEFIELFDISLEDGAEIIEVVKGDTSVTVFVGNSADANLINTVENISAQQQELMVYNISL